MITLLSKYRGDERGPNHFINEATFDTLYDLLVYVGERPHNFSIKKWNYVAYDEAGNLVLCINT